MMSVEEAGELLNTALDGKNKEEAVFNVIRNSDLEKRLKICDYYSQKYGKSLYSDLKSKLSGYFKGIAIHLFLHPLVLEAKLLKKGLKGLVPMKLLF